MLSLSTSSPILLSTSRVGIKTILGNQFLRSSSAISTRYLSSSPCTLSSQKVLECDSWKKTLADEKYDKNENKIIGGKKDERFVITWDHPDATIDQLKKVGVAHHVPENIADSIARRTLLTIRSTFDIFTGYAHPPPGKENDPKYLMTPRRWLMRFVFLESVAGVPGMVGGMVRHLHSLRLMRRDKAWIETLLEEAYNERMHLLTFMKLYNPGIFMRAMLLGAQGVFFNLFFIAYLIMPRICHRFVGYLEEEAIVTYTRCIEDIEAGRLNEWRTAPAPDIAKQYWNMPENSTIYDLILYVRADESKHREVNHTFGNLIQTHDRNPYALKIEDHHTPQPTADLSAPKPTGWKRNEIAA
ncbi:uncharacterized protein SAPINGB_P001594 [Magnusiomyces paraingens]|uniref:Alternative oxidase n=1 Tax=Magnusiomyces paraingens TaxID=2606893 RepID=A0A5E8B749_9ASCO|nr:uncharacterized protein SAPINGB_P001594 [Saprochaete ingens]VVT47203.1 unnamed protein product [Saprochaete ingens]